MPRSTPPPSERHSQAVRRTSAPPAALRKSSRPAPVSYAPGDVIDAKYRLTRLVEDEGGSRRWLAYSLVLGSDVSLQLVRRNGAPPDAAPRVLSDVRAASRLLHPGVARVVDFGQTERHDPFFVMEALHGETLRDLFRRRGRIPANEAVPLLLPIAAAVCAAHARGLVHRGLQPEAIVLTADAKNRLHPKVTGFGLACHASEPPRPSTGRYLAPEQRFGRAHGDERCDIWALCAMLEEMLTAEALPGDAASRPSGEGAAPALGEASDASAGEAAPEPAAQAPPPPRDEALSRILERGLAQAPDSRWPTARAFGRALADWALERGIRTDVSGASIEEVWLAEPSHLMARPVRTSGTLDIATGRISAPDAAEGPAATPAETPERIRNEVYLIAALALVAAAGAMGLVLFGM